MNASLSGKVNLATIVFDCLFACLSTIFILNFFAGVLPGAAIAVLGLIILLAFIGFLLFWAYKDKDPNFPTFKLHAWLTGIIRYGLAYSISVYGFAKIFKTQFGAVYSRNDTLVGSLSGFELTWNYFGYSYKMAIILALLQIGGSALLLFRRTVLLGICVLMPVMINIVLINIFYSIAAGAFMMSLMITGGLTYLLVLNRETFIMLFFKSNSSLPAIDMDNVKPVLRVAILVLAFFTVYRIVMNDKPVGFSGKWKVDKMERNGKILDSNAWMNNNEAWQNIYIEEHGGIALSPNPYVFEPERAKRGTFKYDDKKKLLTIISYKKGNPSDSIQISVIKKSAKEMHWEGSSNNNKFKIFMTKTKVPNQ